MIYNLRNILAATKASYYIVSGQLKDRQKDIEKNDYLLSIYFHNPTFDVFKSCMKWLLKNKYNVISIDALIDTINQDKELPKKSVIITIDDGWKDNYKNIVPVALEYKIPITIFVSTEPVLNGGRFWWSYIKNALEHGIKTKEIKFLKKIPNNERLKYLEEIKHKVIPKREAMTLDEIQDIANTKYITIGSHTVTHPILTNCSDIELTYELNESKKILEQYIYKSVNSFSFPNGDYGKRELEFVKNAGYEISFGVEPKYLDKNELKNRFHLPRFEVLDNASFSENICRMTGLWFNQ